MTNIVAVIEQIIMLFCITAVGAHMRRKQVMTDPVIKGVNSLLLRVAWPCMILMTTQKEYADGDLKNFFSVVLITMAVLTVMCLLTYALSKKWDREHAASIFTVASVMPNAGFVGLPIIKAVYGETGVFYLSAFLVGFNLVVWTVCVFLMTGFSLRSLKSALNPGFIAALVGTALFVFRIALPTPLLSLVTQLGSMTTPLAMLLLGARLEKIPRRLFRSGALWCSNAIKLLVMPLLTAALMRLLGMDATLTGIVVLSMAMPAAAVAQLFAEKYNIDIDFAAAGVALSTLLCIITIPLILLILQV